MPASRTTAKNNSFFDDNNNNNENDNYEDHSKLKYGSPPPPSPKSINIPSKKNVLSSAVVVPSCVNPENGGGGGGRTRQRRASPEEPSDDVHGPLEPSLPVDPAVIYRNLWLFIWLKTIGSFDSGAFSAALGAENGIADEWLLSAAQQGTLTSSVFLGNVLGCPLSGHLFSRYSEKQVLNGSLIVHTVFTFLFASFPTFYVALVNRFFIGLSLAFIVVYTPVWVDAFAPKDRQSIWMASHNAGVPLGIMIGYILGAFFPSYTGIGWEWAFYIKCVFMVPTIVYIAKVDTRSLNAQKRRGRGGEGIPASTAATAIAVGVGDSTSSSATPTPVANSFGGDVIASSGSSSCLPENGILGRFFQRIRSLWAACQLLLYNTIYICSVLAMCSLYFVATGLQNFVTQYLREEPFNAPMKVIMAGFGASVVTAPVCGVIVGGILLDRLGGYQGNLLRVALFEICWGAAAAFFAVICIFLTNAYAFLLVMSVVLFCGGALVPPGAGLTMSSLPEHLRSAGAAFSQTLYNLLGNFSGPLVCGFVAKYTGELKYGIMTLLLSSVLGLAPMSMVLMIALRQHKESTTNSMSVTIFSGEDDNDGSTGATATPQSAVVDMLPDPAVVVKSVDGARGGGGPLLPPPGNTRREYIRNHNKNTRSEAAAGAPMAVTATTEECVLLSESRRQSRGHEEECTPVYMSPLTPALAATTTADVVADRIEAEVSATTASTQAPHSVAAEDATRDNKQQAQQGLTTESSQQFLSESPDSTPATRMNAAAEKARRRKQAAYAAALDDLTMEEEGAQVKSMPGPHSFGKDVVRSWLYSLSREPSERCSASRRDSHGTVVTSPGVRSDDTERAEHNRWDEGVQYNGEEPVASPL